MKILIQILEKSRIHAPTLTDQEAGLQCPRNFDLPARRHLYRLINRTLVNMGLSKTETTTLVGLETPNHEHLPIYLEGKRIICDVAYDGDNTGKTIFSFIVFPLHGRLHAF